MATQEEIDWYDRMMRRVHGPSLQERTQKILRDMALMGVNSPLFAYLRESFAESDTAFRSRMENLSREP